MVRAHSSPPENQSFRLERLIFAMETGLEQDGGQKAVGTDA